MKLGNFLIPAILILLVYLGCSKSNTGTKPRITLESINKSINPGDSMVAMFKFDNSGGTLGNGTFYSVRMRINQKAPDSSKIPGPDTLTSSIPDFGGVSKGEFRYVLNHDDYLSFGPPQNDTLIFKFYALTPDSSSTDTITSPQIIILNP
jgi:hypothetical protein